MKIRTNLGFTLVEIMIVIVILSVFGAMVGLSLGVGASRQNMQRFELLVDDLKYIRLLSMDEQAVLGLQYMPANSIREASYKLVKLNTQTLQETINTVRNTNESNRKFGEFDGLSVDMSAGLSELSSVNKSNFWQDFTGSYEKGISRELSNNMEIKVNPLEQSDIPISDNPIFSNQNSSTPQVLWFGNGEATPVKITLFSEGIQVGNAIFVDKLGYVTTNSSEAGI